MEIQMRHVKSRFVTCVTRLRTPAPPERQVVTLVTSVTRGAARLISANAGQTCYICNKVQASGCRLLVQLWHFAWVLLAAQSQQASGSSCLYIYIYYNNNNNTGLCLLAHKRARVTEDAHKLARVFPARLLVVKKSTSRLAVAGIELRENALSFLIIAPARAFRRVTTPQSAFHSLVTPVTSNLLTEI